MAQVTGYNWHKWEAESFNECVDDAQRILAQAADAWAQGHPEQPPTKEILSEIINVFAERGFLKQPYGSRQP